MSKPSNHNPDPAVASAEINFELSLEDTAAQRSRGLAIPGRKGLIGGYNPYDATPLAKPAAGRVERAAAPTPGEAKRKPTDLRKLSEWIRVQRQVDALKREPPEPDPDTD